MCILLLSACSSDGQRRTAEPASTAANRQTTVTTEAVGSLALDCRDPIAEMPAPPTGYEVIGDAVALVTSATSDTALQTSTSGEPNPSQRLFAKNGLLVRTNVRSELIVPPAWHDRLSFQWGNAGPRQATEHLVVGQCDGGANWIAFPGGYLVSDPACVDFIVRAGDGDHRVTVGVGAPCEGQRPPPEPTDA
jgi:hypothetical protein